MAKAGWSLLQASNAEEQNQALQENAVHLAETTAKLLTWTNHALFKETWKTRPPVQALAYSVKFIAVRAVQLQQQGELDVAGFFSGARMGGKAIDMLYDTGRLARRIVNDKPLLFAWAMMVLTPYGGFKGLLLNVTAMTLSSVLFATSDDANKQATKVVKSPYYKPALVGLATIAALTWLRPAFMSQVVNPTSFFRFNSFFYGIGAGYYVGQDVIRGFRQGDFISEDLTIDV